MLVGGETAAVQTSEGDLNTYEILRRPDVGSRPAGPNDNGTDYGGEGVLW
jgi:hypothetical protein